MTHSRPSIILLNGPPGCGKDLAAEHLIRTLGAFSSKFSFPIKSAWTYGMLEADPSVVDLISGLPIGHDTQLHKNTVVPWLGTSPRQWMIDFSEKFMKPLYGEDVFARVAAEKINEIILAYEESGNLVPLLCFSDCGLQPEVDTFAKLLLPTCNLLLIRIHRNGCSFAGDSREWVYTLNNKFPSMDISNNGAKEKFLSAIYSAAEALVDEPRDPFR